MRIFDSFSIKKIMNYIFIRHAESEGNVNPNLYHTISDPDIDITKNGENQCINCVESIVNLLDVENINSKNINLYYSPYLRTTRTKDIIVNQLGYDFIFPTQKMSPLLIERAYGNLRNLIKTEKNIEKYFNFYYKPDMGESFIECYQRSVIFDNMIKSNHHRNDTIMLVGHGDQIRCHLMHLLGWSIEGLNRCKTIKNCGIVLVSDGKLSKHTPLNNRVKN
jgi:broad specificity phosphatase PhoE